MKKINLLAVALFFTVTTKAHADHLGLYLEPIIDKVCEIRKNFSTCVENSTNAKEMSSCGSDGYYNILKHIKRAFSSSSDYINYVESFDYETFYTEARFVYLLSRGNHDSHGSHDAIQIHPSCKKIKISKGTPTYLGGWFRNTWKNKSGTMKRIIEADNPNRFSSVKTCALSMASEMSRVQDCE